MTSLPQWVEPVARQLLSGVGVSGRIVLVTVFAGSLLGLLLGVLATWRLLIVKVLVRGYIELWRGLPIVVTVFFIFFSLPVLGVRLGPVTAAMIGLTLWGSANIAELVRGSIESISENQWKGAAALGMSWGQTMRSVILPQSFRRLIPPSIGILMILVQASTVAGLIGAQEVLAVGRQSINRLTVSTGEIYSMQILMAVLVGFVLVCGALDWLSRLAERKLSLREGSA